jgi:CHASE3 domain sensor protein
MNDDYLADVMGLIIGVFLALVVVVFIIWILSYMVT